MSDLEDTLKVEYSEVYVIDLNRETGDNQWDFKIERNELYLQDNWYMILTDPIKSTFNSLDSNFVSRREQFNGDKYSFIFSLSQRKNQYSRQVLTFLEVTGILGGIFEIIDIFAGALLGFIYTSFMKKELNQELVRAHNKIQKLADSIEKIKEAQKRANIEGENEEKEGNDQNEEEKEGGSGDKMNSFKPNSS